MSANLIKAIKSYGDTRICNALGVLDDAEVGSAMDRIFHAIEEDGVFEKFIASVEGMDSPKCPCHYCASEQTRPEGA